MKYVLLIYGAPEQWEHPVFRHEPRFRALSADRQAALLEQWHTLRREIVGSGELVDGVALGPPSDASTVRVRGGAVLVTDGPYAEAKEHLAGYLLVDCVGPERAAEIAARLPDVTFGAVEVRALVEHVVS